MWIRLHVQAEPQLSTGWSCMSLLESLRHLNGPSLDQLHNVQISLYWGPSSSDKPHQCLAEGKDHLPHPQPAARALPGAAPAAVGLCAGAELVQGHSPIQHPPRAIALPCQLLCRWHQPPAHPAAAHRSGTRFNLFGNKGILSVLHPLHVCCGTVPLMNISLSALRTGQAKRRFQLLFGGKTF